MQPQHLDRIEPRDLRWQVEQDETRPAATLTTASISSSSCMLAVSQATKMVSVGCLSTNASRNRAIS